MPYTIDTSKISLTTVQGYLSAGAMFALSLVAIFPGHAVWFASTASVLGALKAAVGTLQQDATKPTDSEGKPVASSEVPTAK